ncbi:uncharacterized protein [Choristoneura fumiferana]|uniref:uncharacterized protein n=1 Tax=Choristoneura fumiferana TaxID=7141 RepID=UPI003D156BE6
MWGHSSITVALLLYVAVVINSCPKWAPGETTTNNKGLRPPHGEDLDFDPNATTLFPKRYTKRTPEPEDLNGPKPGHPKWDKGWGAPEGQKTPWGGGGTNPTTPDPDARPGADYDPNYPHGFYYDQYGNKIPAKEGQTTYIDADGNERPIKGQKDEFPHGYYYDANGNKVAATEGQETYVDANGIKKPVRGRPDPYPHGYYYDADGNKVAAKEGQDYYFDADGNKKPVKQDYYPNGYYYDKNGNKIPAKPGQDYYYDEDGIKKPVIKDHGYYLDKDGNKVPAKPGQEFYYDENGNKKPIRGKPPAKENPNPWADDPNVPDSWKGLGPGFGGGPPPPWAWVPANYGKPAYCFLPPTKGKCQDKIMRFAYNPFKDECVEFPYSGCGGNGNNFLTKERCETECTKMPEPDCDPLAYDRVNLANYMEISRRCLR